jgi:hypothetical protein
MVVSKRIRKQAWEGITRGEGEEQEEKKGKGKRKDDGNSDS